MSKTLKNYGIILASGSGSRFGSDIPKQFIKIGEKTILELSIEVFEANNNIDEIIVVITPEYRNLADNILQKNSYKKVSQLLNGGQTRKDSSLIGISAIKDNEANVFIHDCARPLVNNRIISDCTNALETHNAVCVAVSSTDTIFEIDEKNTLTKTLERSKLKCAQTPQCFKLSIIKKAHELSKDDKTFTDDCGLVSKHNLAEIYIVDGDTENIKITYPNDVFIAKRILDERKGNL